MGSTVWKPESYKMSSGLIDNVVGGYHNEHVFIEGEWYYKKPAAWVPLRRKLAWCKEILLGKAIAVHYKEDEA